MLGDLMTQVRLIRGLLEELSNRLILSGDSVNLEGAGQVDGVPAEISLEALILKT